MNSCRQGQRLQDRREQVPTWLRSGGAGSSRKSQQYRRNRQLQDELKPRQQLAVQGEKNSAEQRPNLPLSNRWRQQHWWQQLSMQEQQDQQPAAAGRAMGRERRSVGGLPHSQYTIRHKQPGATHSSYQKKNCKVSRRRWYRSNSKQSWRKHQTKYWRIKQYCWVPKFHVPASMRAVVARLLRPMNLWGWRAPGMRAPRNTTQFIMNQVYQDMQQQEKEAAAKKKAALAAAASSLIEEEPASQPSRGNYVCNQGAENFSHTGTVSSVTPGSCFSIGEGDEDSRQ